MNTSDQERFWSKINVVGHNDCWDWLASKNTNGYGAFGFAGKVLRAHRVAWELCVGEIPEGVHILHRCDNPPCCNPAHLFPGTNLDNIADKTAKRRTCSQPGVRNGMARLNDRKVRTARQFNLAGIFSVRELADIHEFSYDGMWGVLRGGKWNHLNEKETTNTNV